MDSLAIVSDADLTVGCFKATATGLDIEGTPTLESWRHFGRQLGQLHDAIQLCIGDWILFGEHAYGEMYADALDDTGLEYSTLTKYVFVARTFSRERGLFSPRATIRRWTHLKYLAEVANTDYIIDRDLIDFGVQLYQAGQSLDNPVPAEKFRRLLLIERDGRNPRPEDVVYMALYTILEQARAGYDSREAVLNKALETVKPRLSVDYRDLVEDILSLVGQNTGF